MVVHFFNVAVIIGGIIPFLASAVLLLYKCLNHRQTTQFLVWFQISLLMMGYLSMVIVGILLLDLTLEGMSYEYALNTSAARLTYFIFFIYMT